MSLNIDGIVPISDEVYRYPFLVNGRSTKLKSIPFIKAQNADETATYRNAVLPDPLLKDFPTMKTVEDIFMNTVKQVPNRPLFGTRKPNPDGSWTGFQWKTYKEVDIERRNFGAGLLHVMKGLQEQPEQPFLGIFSQNREEWLTADLGSMLYKIPSVALYSTLGADSSKFILNHSKMTICCAEIAKVPILLEIAPECPQLKVIIVFESPFKNQQDPIPILTQWAATLGIKIIPFRQVQEIGKKYPATPPKLYASDMVALQYTSGTTGNPKGAMICHSNFVSNSRAGIVDLVNGEWYISYLPLAHIMERSILVSLMLYGSAIGFFRGDLSLLLEDIAELKPTFFATVPRLLVRIYDKIMAATIGAGGLKAKLFERALSDKTYYLNNGGSVTHSLWDPILFSKIKKVLGGRVKFIGTGSAPVSPEILTFFRVCFSCIVLEGYGLTESTAGVTGTARFDFASGSVGSVNPNSEIKLVSVPEMNYHARDLKGEVWIRGHGIFMGYYLDKAKTDEALTPDGWLKTGDIGTFDKEGRLTIVDRKKNIFKLAQGEYVAPEKLENIYIKSQYVAQAFVHGDSLQSELVAIVVPDQEVCLPYAVANGFLPKDTVIPPPPLPGQPLDPLVAKLAKNPKFVKVIFNDLAKVAKANNLLGFEIIKAIYVDGNLFTPESGILTPTFKLKRQFAANVYREQIDKMYAELKSRPSNSKF